MAGRQGRGARDGGIPFRHGPHHSHRAESVAPDLPRGGSVAGRGARTRTARSPVALFLRGRLGSRSARADGHDVRRAAAILARNRLRQGLPRLRRAIGAAPRHLGPLLLLEVGRGPEGHHGLQGQSQPLDAPRRHEPQDGADRGGDHPLANPRRQGVADARPLHPIRRLVALQLPGRPGQHRPHAARRGRLVSDGRDPCCAGGSRAARGRAGRRDPPPAPEFGACWSETAP